MTDRRFHFANSRIAHESLRGDVQAPQFAEGAARQVVSPVADLCAAQRGKRDAQLLMGTEFEVLETHEGWSFGRSLEDGYVGYVAAEQLGPTAISTHWISARSSQIYSAADIKSPEIANISFGSKLAVARIEGTFAELETGGFVPVQHLSTKTLTDPALVALGFLGVPYLWGGNSSLGIDCSGLVQQSLRACGTECPRDSDQQEAYFTEDVTDAAMMRRGDLVFWKGHVGMMLNEQEMIHANAHHMAVAIESFSEACARIGANEFGQITAMKRP
ncbi:NlpC/P60 family protein [Falsihalocynthiibacter sp. SS001]|uniref:C40 family peptidase n=1 Tax=Falsihalocynthiibacter sp. SS001 TaxID=3349698 RepID=UPI0036D413AD